MDSIWGFISQSTGDIISQGSGLASSTWEMGRERVPANNSLPSLETVPGFVYQKMGDTVNQGSVFLCSAWEKINASPLPMQIVRFIQETAAATVRFAKSALDFSVESIKQHPYLFGLIVIFIVAETCGGGAGAVAGKMMKAIGYREQVLRRIPDLTFVA